MRKYLFIICISLFCTNFSFAQESGKWRGGVEIGYLYAHSQDIGSLLGAAEVKYNVRNNMNVGLKVEGLELTGCGCHGHKIVSFAATYDYYFHSKNKQSSPFIGTGLGYYFGENYNEGEQTKYYNNPAWLIRAGYEIGKFRISLAYNLLIIPNDVNPYDNNNYIALNIGFYLGGGKWKKN
jgi:hypothetical protein